MTRTNLTMKEMREMIASTEKYICRLEEMETEIDYIKSSDETVDGELEWY